MVSSILDLNSSSFISSNNFAVSPNDEEFSVSGIIENNISCKYFQKIFFVFSLIFCLYKTEKSIPGSNSIVSLKISSFLYKKSKNLGGYTFLQNSNISNASDVSYCSFNIFVNPLFKLSFNSG